MAEVTINDLSVTDLPMEVKSGTGKRRALVTINYLPADASGTITLATHIPGIADVEGIVMDTVGSVVTGTAATWSTTTITAAGGLGAATSDLAVIVNFT